MKSKRKNNYHYIQTKLLYVCDKQSAGQAGRSSKHPARIAGGSNSKCLFQG